MSDMPPEAIVMSRLTFVLVLLSVATVQAAEHPAISAALPPGKRPAVEQFLAKLEPPRTLLPPQAKVVELITGVPVAPAPADAPVKEYLAEVRAHKATGREGAKQADVYFFRPHPVKGQVGVTIKRVVDLQTGEQVGEPTVLVGYAAPLTREERNEAIALAKEQSPNAKALFAASEPSAIEVTALFDQLVTKVPDGNPGDRVAILQIRTAGDPAVLNVTVNLTRGTVRTP